MVPWVSCALRTPPTAGIRSSVGCHPRLGYRHRYAIQTVLPPLRGSVIFFMAPWVSCALRTPPTAGIRPSLCDSKVQPPRRGSIGCCYVSVGCTHGWGPSTATRFDWLLLRFRGLSPTAGIRSPVGCHPRLGSFHRDAVRLVVVTFPWVVTHGWGIVTTTWFYSATSSKKTVGPSCRAAVSMVMSVTISRLARGSS